MTNFDAVVVRAGRGSATGLVIAVALFVSSACGPSGGNNTNTGNDSGTSSTMDGDTTGDAAADTSPVDVYDNTKLPDGAPSPCLGATDCSGCTDRSPCGWCHGQCLPGLASGSFDGTCTGDTWQYRGVQCGGSGTQCGSHTDCTSCATDPDSCGWCTNTHQCVAGDNVGPSSAVSGCAASASTWVYNLDMQQCPAGP